MLGIGLVGMLYGYSRDRDAYSRDAIGVVARGHRDGCYRDRPSRDATVGMSRGDEMSRPTSKWMLY